MTKQEFKRIEASCGTYAAAWLARELGVSLAVVQLWRVTK